jgi:predicted RNA-binding Zn-ribbon protein involved in translation (DUF1610 family)
MRDHVCPICGEHALQRSRRRGVERLLSVFGVLPFRCDACTWRGLRLAPRSARSPHAGEADSRGISSQSGQIATAAPPSR